jgi:hypothetical protein
VHVPVQCLEGNKLRKLFAPVFIAPTVFAALGRRHNHLALAPALVPAPAPALAPALALVPAPALAPALALALALALGLATGSGTAGRTMTPCMRRLVATLHRQRGSGAQQPAMRARGVVDGGTPARRHGQARCNRCRLLRSRLALLGLLALLALLGGRR